MEKHSSTLNRLPSEIIQRIASLGDVKAMLSLRTVNKALNKICDNPVVVRNLIDYGNAIPSRYGYDRDLAPWTPPLTLNASTRTWAQWAYADTKALDFIGRIFQRRQEVEAWHERRRLGHNQGNIRLATRWVHLEIPESALQWLPSLIATQRMCTQSSRSKRI